MSCSAKISYVALGVVLGLGVYFFSELLWSDGEISERILNYVRERCTASCRLDLDKLQNHKNPIDALR